MRAAKITNASGKLATNSRKKYLIKCVSRELDENKNTAIQEADVSMGYHGVSWGVIWCQERCHGVSWGVLGCQGVSGGVTHHLALWEIAV
jgi:hypothetical protein